MSLLKMVDIYLDLPRYINDCITCIPPLPPLPLTPKQSPSTIMNYKKVLDFIEQKGIDYKNITNMGEYIEKINTLLKIDGLPISDGTVKVYLVATQWYLKTNKLNIDEQKIIKAEIEKIKREHDDKVKQHVLIGYQKENYLPWEDIIKVHDKLTISYKKNYTTYTNYVLLSCYVLLCPRRLTDYAMMYVIDLEEDLDKSRNYYVRSKKYFIFNIYKTQKCYKTQYIMVPEKLAIILDEYIDTFKKSEYIFELSSHAIQQKLTRLFQTHTNKNISVDILRHSYITWATNNGTINDNNKHIIAQIMGHSRPVRFYHFDCKVKTYECTCSYVQYMLREETKS
jgi:integrase